MINKKCPGEEMIPNFYKEWIYDDANGFTNEEKQILIEDFAAYFTKRRNRIEKRINKRGTIEITESSHPG